MIKPDEDIEQQEVQEQFYNLVVPHWRDLIKEHWGEWHTLDYIANFLRKTFGQKLDRELLRRCRKIAIEFFNYNIPYRLEETETK